MSLEETFEQHPVHDVLSSMITSGTLQSSLEKPLFRLGHVGWYLHTKMTDPLEMLQAESAESEMSKDVKPECPAKGSAEQHHEFKADVPLGQESDQCEDSKDLFCPRTEAEVPNKIVPEETQGLKSHISESTRGNTAPLSGLSRILIKIVNGQKQYLCNECPYRSNLKRSVNRHVEAVHMGLRSFNCPYCEYKANYMSNIKRHITSVHDGHRRFACPKCDYRTSDKGHLSSHIKVVHEKLKPFQCLECNYHASKRTDLNIHVKTVHNKEKPHRCPYCSYKASKNGNMKRHIKILHEDPPPRKRKRSAVNYNVIQNSDTRGKSTRVNDDKASEESPLISDRLWNLKQELIVETVNQTLYSSDALKHPIEDQQETEHPIKSIKSLKTSVHSQLKIPQIATSRGFEISLVSKVDLPDADLVSQMMKNRDLEISLVPKTK